MLDKETWVLILINLHEVQTISEGYIAYFVDVLPESLVADPRLLLFRRVGPEGHDNYVIGTDSDFFPEAIAQYMNS
ncbi:uncharacterized protein N7473_012882 [Penicillium subrubescens]|uniref:Uncharacterized protein n=1 Tax=Penicillium subrubescens TaxID=1316194 RepID=A0A1Q5TGK9_9EURO|nr:uncharacterized protein N7473_012882 [Penicillium subrubescens]KAJ5875535.1 hypothetical protein N7473_012882 [Penicillium subrubescens]OKO99373.1 hypothetical protein PENSUB_8457 [Penicillium subrubescens]